MKRVNEKLDSSLKDAEFIAGVGWALLLVAAGADVLQILTGSGTESPSSNTSVREGILPGVSEAQVYAVRNDELGLVAGGDSGKGTDIEGSNK